MVYSSYMDFMAKGPSLSIMFGFEYFILLVGCMSIGVKYLVGRIDDYYSTGSWIGDVGVQLQNDLDIEARMHGWFHESKAMILFYSEIFFGMFQMFC